MARIPLPALLMAVLVGTVHSPALAQTSARHKTKSAANKRAKTAANAAPTWKTVYQDNTVTVSIDSKGTKKLKDGTYHAHLRWEYASDQPIGRGKSYRLMRETRLLDCGTSVRTKPISAYTFDAKGKSVSSFDTPAKDVQYLPWGMRKQGTTSAQALAGVCKAIKAPETI